MDRSFPFLVLVWFIFGFFSNFLILVYGNLEGDALYTLKEKFTDPANVLQTWNQSLANPCTWFHVTCNSDNSTIRVDLGGANLSGQLVPELGQLTNLQYLELYNNHISGKIPSELGNLTQLLSLDLYQNQLDGDIPATLGKLQKLRYLRLNNNKLRGTIPSSLTTIYTLQVLDLSSNLLSGDIPVNGSFTNFTKLSFINNTHLIFLPPIGQAPDSPSPSGDALYTLKEKIIDPTGVIQSWDKNLPNPCTWFNVSCNTEDSVIRVDLGGANLSGELVPDLGQLTNLRYLALYNNNFTGKIPYELGNLTQLWSLDLYQNQLDGDIPATLGNLQNLQSLRLNYNKLRGTIPSSLTTINTLQILDLSSNLLSGDIPVNGSFTKFTKLSFANNTNQLIYPPSVTMLKFFKKIGSSSVIDNNNNPKTSNMVEEPSNVGGAVLGDDDQETPPRKYIKVDLNSLPADPGERPSIETYHVNQRDEIRRAYLQKGPCQPQVRSFPQRNIGGRLRRFCLHLMVEILGVTNELNMTLQKKDQDIVNAMHQVRVSKMRLQGIRNVGWESLLDEVTSFCNEFDAEILNMTDPYFNGISRRHGSHVTYLHHYKVDVFYSIIDMQLQELNNRFDEVSTQLLLSMASLCPSKSFKAFEVDDLMKMADFYPLEFPSCDQRALKSQLKNYIVDVRQDARFDNLKSIGDLSKMMVETRKQTIFPKVYLLVKLVLILPVATSTVERAFSAMKLIKTDLRNRIGDEFMNDCLVSYIEKDVLDGVSNDTIIDTFHDMKFRREQL